MIPLSIIRALFLLFAISALLAATDTIFVSIGIPAESSKRLGGGLAGLTVFMLAFFGGTTMKLLAKRIVKNADAKQSVAEALEHTGWRRKWPAMVVVDTEAFVVSTVRNGLGHTVFVSTAAIQNTSREALSAILAHELTHVRLNHPLRLCFLLGLLAFVKIAIGVPLLATVFVLLAFLYMLRRWEFDADRGAAGMVGAQAVCDALEQFSRYAGKPIGPVMEWFSGHPRIVRRIAALKAIKET